MVKEDYGEVRDWIKEPEPSTDKAGDISSNGERITSANKWVKKCPRCEGRGRVQIAPEFYTQGEPNKADCAVCCGRGWHLTDEAQELVDVLQVTGVEMEYPESRFELYCKH